MNTESIEIKKHYYSGNFEIIDSGSVIASFRESDLLVELLLDNSFSFSIRFMFLVDSNDDKQRFRLEEGNDQEIKVLCYNFDNSVGIGSVDMFPIAVFKGKTLFLRFWVELLGQKATRRIDYSIYRGKGE